MTYKVSAILAVASLFVATSCADCDKSRAKQPETGDLADTNSDSNRDTSDETHDTRDERSHDTVDDTERDSEPDADATFQPPVPSWLEGADNACAPTEVRVPAERLAPPSLPEPLGEVPRQAWTAEASCVPGGKFNGASYALAHLTIEGEKRPVIIAGVQAHTALTLSDKLVAIAFVDARTGELLRCREFDEPLLLPEPEIIVSSDLEQYWLYTETIRDARDYVEEPVHVLHSGTFEEELYTRRISDPGEARILLNFITPNGQWLMGFGREYLVSFDALSGDALWAKHVSELSESAGRDATLFNAYYKNDTEAFVSINTGDSTHAVVSVDECGNVEPMMEGHGRSPSVREIPGYRFLTVSRDRARHLLTYQDGDEIHSELCPAVMHFKDDRHACFHRGEDTATFASFGPDGGNHVTAELPSLDQYHYGRYWRRAVAARDGQILVQRNTNESAESELESFLFIVDPETGDMSEGFSTPQPSEPISHELLTSSGMLIFESNDELYGYQTSIPGLAETPSPRGVGVGGNENRGWVDVSSQ